MVHHPKNIPRRGPNTDPSTKISHVRNRMQLLIWLQASYCLLLVELLPESFKIPWLRRIRVADLDEKNGKKSWDLLYMHIRHIIFGVVSRVWFGVLISSSSGRLHPSKHSSPALRQEMLRRSWHLSRDASPISMIFYDCWEKSKLRTSCVSYLMGYTILPPIKKYPF